GPTLRPPPRLPEMVGPDAASLRRAAQERRPRGRRAVELHPEDLAVEAADAQDLGLGAARARVSRRCPELPVRHDLDVAPVVIPGRGVDVVEDDRLAPER